MCGGGHAKEQRVVLAVVFTALVHGACRVAFMYAYLCAEYIHVHVIGGKYGIRSVLSGLRILEECVSPDAMLGFEG